MVGKWLNKLSEVGFLHGGDHFTVQPQIFFKPICYPSRMNGENHQCISNFNLIENIQIWS